MEFPSTESVIIVKENEGDCLFIKRAITLVKTGDPINVHGKINRETQINEEYGQ